MLVLAESMINILCLYPISGEIAGMFSLSILIGNLLFAILLPLLWFYLHFTNFDKLPLYIRVVNWHLPGIVIIGISIGSSLLTAYGTGVQEMFLKVLPVELFIWILWYILVFQFFKYTLSSAAREFLEDELLSGAKEVPKAELLDSFAVKQGKQLHIVTAETILYLQAYGDYVTVVTPQGKFLKEQTLKYFEEHLPHEFFVRIHRSYIVNIRFIASIERYGKDQYRVLLHNKEQIKATVNGYKRLKEKLKL
jgi:small-conductance mechanosensitive channel